MSKIPKTEEEVKELMFQELWSIEQSISKSTGMGLVMVDSKGDIKTFFVYGMGAKLPLLGGIQLLSHELTQNIQKDVEHE